MGTGKRLDPKPIALSPGPGSYRVSSSIREAGYSMGLKTDHSVSQGKIFSPGPGQYEPRHFNKTFAYSMGSKDSKNNQVLSPGPGAYESRDNLEESKRGPRFGSQVRNNSLSGPAPGPGAYEQHTETLKQASPKFGFGTQSRDKAFKVRHFSPGPGAYQLPGLVGPTGPKKSMGPRTDIPNLYKDTPGPGQYNNQEDNVINKAAPKYGMGS